GVYRELRAKRIAIGDDYIDGANYTWQDTESGSGEVDFNADLVVEGNVGIGTVNPAVKLDVRGIVAVNGGSLFAASNSYLTAGALDIGDYERSYGGGTSQWSTNTAGLLLETLDNTEIAVHDAGSRVASLMYFEGGGTNRITIGRNMGWDAISTVAINGNVGIGTTSPPTLLTLAGGGLAISNNPSSLSTTEGARRSIQISTDTSYGGTYNDHTGSLIYSTMPGGWGTSHLEIRHSTDWGTYASVPDMVIGSNVGIGTGSPNSKLQITSSADNAPFITIGHANWPTTAYAGIGGWVTNGNGNTVGRLILFTRQSISDSSMTAGLTLDEGGNVGIGTTNPASRLDIGGGTISGGYLGRNSTYYQGSTGNPCNIYCNSGYYVYGVYRGGDGSIDGIYCAKL
ncbi:MAG: hypothetical protein WC578_07055, partial [Candidatus Omnitrophota bacterium]